MDGTENEFTAPRSGYPGTPGESPGVSTSSDSRSAIGYLLRPEADDSIAIMDVLEASVTELTTAEVNADLASAGRRLPAHVVEARLGAAPPGGMG